MSNYSRAKNPGNALRIVGLQLHQVGVDETHAYIDQVIQSGERALVLNLNINCCNLAMKNPWLKEFLNSAQLVFCDGDGVRWGLKVLGKNPPPKITYDRWMWQLGEWMERKGHSFFFLGGAPGVSAKAAEKMKAKFPNLKILGVRDGFFSKEGEENDQLIAEINRLKPDVMVIGFGMPAQEKWLKENWEKIDCHVYLTGGACFDYVAGNAKRAPEWMIRANLEWLFRLSQEPRRLFSRYVVGNPVFFYHVFKEKFFGKGSS